MVHSNICLQSSLTSANDSEQLPSPMRMLCLSTMQSFCGTVRNAVVRLAARRCPLDPSGPARSFQEMRHNLTSRVFRQATLISSSAFIDTLEHSIRLHVHRFM